MYEIVCLLDILDSLKYIHIYFYMKNLDFLLLDIGSVYIYSLWVSFTRFKFKKKSTLYILWYDPRCSYLRSIFASADESKEVNVHFQYYNCPNFTILHIF